MANFLDQLPALVGVVVGAVSTLTATTINDRVRWRREQSVRWDQRRLEVYATLGTRVKEVLTTCYRLAAPLRKGSSTPIEREPGLQLLVEQDTALTAAWEGMLLLGDEATVTAARGWREAVQRIERLVRDSVVDDERWRAAVSANDEARDRFYVAARASLSVLGGSVAQADVLRARRES